MRTVNFLNGSNFNFQMRICFYAWESDLIDLRDVFFFYCIMKPVTGPSLAME